MDACLLPVTFEDDGATAFGLGMRSMEGEGGQGRGRAMPQCKHPKGVERS
jgi:hypothetical protein